MGNEIALDIGFWLIQESQKHRPRNEYYKIVCDRAGKYSKIVTPEKKQRTNTSTKKCECPFKLVITGSVEKGYLLVPRHGFHNHNMLAYRDGHRGSTRFTTEQVEFIKQQKDAVIKVAKVKLSFSKKFKNQPQPVIRQFYNLNSKLAVEDREGRNHAQQMLRLATNKHYVYFTDMDPETNQLMRIFMAHPEGSNMVTLYPFVFGIDSTYKTNMYGMALVELVGITPTGKSFLIAYAIISDEKTESYVWVLEQLKHMLNGAVPTAIITDRELGLLAALDRVFHEVPHMLCRWHVDRGVENFAKRFYNDGNTGQAFVNKRWKELVNSNSEVNFWIRWEQLRRERKLRRLVQYLEITWICYADKFVKCYTNKILHFGTTTTSRVESAHAVLKDWLGSSTLALDSIWVKIDGLMTNQHCEIRKALENSRSRIRHDNLGNLFCTLKGYVSHKGLEIMEDEHKRGLTLGDGLSREQCGCAIRTSHGLPCACFLHELQSENRGVHLDQCHVFWRTLELEVVPMTDFTRFDAYCEEIRRSHPSVLRRVMDFMGRHLHPENENVHEPPVKETRKGRPRKCTTRNQSAFEHTRRQFPTSRSQPFTTAETLNLGAGAPWESFDLKQDHGSWWYYFMLPAPIKEYLLGWFDPIGDGHCGFRVMAHAVRNDEKHYNSMRTALLREIEFIRYEHVYGSLDYHLRIPHNRIAYMVEIPVGPAHWLNVWDFFGFATIYNWVICVIAHMRLNNGKRNWFGSSTYLPIRAETGIQSPCGIVWVLFTGNHFIRLFVSDDTPMPPVHSNWYRAKTMSVDGWDQLYEDKLVRWRNMFPDKSGTHEDPQLLSP